MVKRKNYDEEAEKLAKAIDIALDAFQKHPMEGWSADQIGTVTSQYTQWKQEVLNPEPAFKKIASLKYMVEAVFTHFQEGSGPAVEYFWQAIQSEELPFQRENKLEKILARGKIKGRIEYEYVTDMMVVAEQIGLVSPAQAIRLSEMLGEFEAKKRQ